MFYSRVGTIRCSPILRNAFSLIATPRRVGLRQTTLHDRPAGSLACLPCHRTSSEPVTSRSNKPTEMRFISRFLRRRMRLQTSNRRPSTGPSSLLTADREEGPYFFFGRLRILGAPLPEMWDGLRPCGSALGSRKWTPGHSTPQFPADRHVGARGPRGEQRCGRSAELYALGRGD